MKEIFNLIPIAMEKAEEEDQKSFEEMMREFYVEEDESSTSRE